MVSYSAHREDERRQLQQEIVTGTGPFCRFGPVIQTPTLGAPQLGADTESITAALGLVAQLAEATGLEPVEYRSESDLVH